MWPNVDILTTRRTRVKERKLIDYNMIDWLIDGGEREREFAKYQRCSSTSLHLEYALLPAE